MKASSLIFSLSLTTLAGCSGMGVGKSDFSCDGLEEGVRCMSATDVYEETETTDKVGFTHDESGNKIVKETSGDKEEKDTNMVAETYKGTAPKVLPKVEYPQPVRMPAQIMRIWFGPWEDKQGDLNVGKTIYTELVPRRWTLADVDLIPGKRTYVPLDIQ